MSLRTVMWCPAIKSGRNWTLCVHSMRGTLADCRREFAPSGVEVKYVKVRIEEVNTAGYRVRRKIE